MKTTNRQSFTVNALIVLLMILFIISGSLMWSQHNQYHRTLWNIDGQIQNSSISHMGWFDSTETH